MMEMNESQHCNNCSHVEICKYKDDFTKIYNDIKQMDSDNGSFLNVVIRCKHWNGRIHSIR